MSCSDVTADGRDSGAHEDVEHPRTPLILVPRRTASSSVSGSRNHQVEGHESGLTIVATRAATVRTGPDSSAVFGHKENAMFKHPAAATATAIASIALFTFLVAAQPLPALAAEITVQGPVSFRVLFP